MMPALTVIIPVYNTQAYLEKCVSSVLNQTLTNIEILCIDDCSIDNSPAILRSLQARDARIRIVRHERNLGLGEVRNTGIRLASAPYLASVDSDDYIAPDMLEILYRAAMEDDHDIVACGWADVDENERVLGTASFEDRVVDLRNCPADMDILNIVNPSFCMKLWRRALFIENDIFFPSDMYYEDLATTPRLLLKAKDIRFVEGDYYRYLLRGGSIMNTLSAKHAFDYFHVFDILKEFLLAEDIFLRHEASFDLLVTKHLSYYAGKIAGLDVDLRKKQQYLKYLVLLAEAYGKSDAQYRRHDIDQLRSAIMEGAGSDGSSPADDADADTDHARLVQPEWYSRSPVRFVPSPLLPVMAAVAGRCGDVFRHEALRQLSRRLASVQILNKRP